MNSSKQLSVTITLEDHIGLPYNYIESNDHYNIIAKVSSS